MGDDSLAVLTEHFSSVSFFILQKQSKLCNETHADIFRINKKKRKESAFLDGCIHHVVAGNVCSTILNETEGRKKDK